MGHVSEVHYDTPPEAEAAKKTPSGANAPYKIVKQGTKFAVLNNAGETKATFKTKAAAVDYQSALYANVKGAARRAGKVQFTGKAKNRVPPRPKPKTATASEQAKSFSAPARKQAAGKGQAMPGGSFPIQNKSDLKNAIAANGRAKNKAAAKAHIIRRAKALGATSMLPEGWMTTTDKAHAGLIDCPECNRAFRNEQQLNDHAEAVHTFDDIRRAVSSKVRAEYGRQGDYRANPIVPSIYVWVDDMASDWVVFQIEGEGNNEPNLMRASYVIDDAGDVTLGEPVQVVRRTVYDVVGTNSRSN
jgi:hypothetical protein